ncbi:hypothetical protein LTR12_000461 [Friedmanniomyces endolithicus]|nr:hypothetical protein LTR74_013644 [Friedmanniomyces endolithicus]KAK1825172.1 hypothetical protein LTR12_000461 [Friedmanniomyces endolithicus]
MPLAAASAAAIAAAPTTTRGAGRPKKQVLAKQAALAEFVAAMRIFDPAFTSADSIAVGKATLEYSRRNPKQNRLYTGPGAGRLIKAAHDN